MKSPKTWILIANGARARIVAAEGRGKALRIVEKLELRGDHSPNRDLQRDKPTRVFESNGDARHGVQAKTDPHRELKRDFAQVIADTLDENLSQKHFERLVVVAPAVTLGDLRTALSEAVKSTVVSEVVMDLTKVPNNEVARHIEDAIPL